MKSGTNVASDLDISRQSIIVLVKRKNKVLIPNGGLMLREGGNVSVYTQQKIADATQIEL